MNVMRRALHRQAGKFPVAIRIENAEVDPGGVLGPDRKIGAVPGRNDASLSNVMWCHETGLR